jgi:hypothetical protein
MGRRKLKCPKCGNEGDAIIDDGPPFTVKNLPFRFRITKISDRDEGFKVRCSCGEIFEISRPA